MPSLNFKKELSSKVESGEKKQTIRKKRKRPWKIGDILHLFTGQRTKSCRRIGTGEIVEVAEITITGSRKVGIKKSVIKFVRWLEYLNNAELLELAIADGFETSEDFIDFFESHYGLPFTGDLIKWVRLVSPGVYISKVESAGRKLSNE